MVAQQILFNKPACALPVRAEIDWDAVVDDDRERGSNDRTRMRTRMIGSAEQVIKPGFDYHAGAVVFGELQQLLAEPISVADNRVDKVLGRLSLNRNLALQTGE